MEKVEKWHTDIARLEKQGSSIESLSWLRIDMGIIFALSQRDILMFTFLDGYDSMFWPTYLAVEAYFYGRFVQQRKSHLAKIN